MKRLFILITLTSAFFVGCGQGYVQGTDIPFTIVAEDHDMAGINNDHYRGDMIKMEWASTESEQETVKKLVTPEYKQTIANTSIEQSILGAVFMGEKYGSGYSVHVNKVIRIESQLYIYARCATPQPGKLQEGGTRSPFSIVSIERSALPANVPLTVHLMDDATKQEVLVQEYIVK